jgi:hypothetical protein
VSLGSFKDPLAYLYYYYYYYYYYSVEIEPSFLTHTSRSLATIPTAGIFYPEIVRERERQGERGMSKKRWARTKRMNKTSRRKYLKLKRETKK